MTDPLGEKSDINIIFGHNLVVGALGDDGWALLSLYRPSFVCISIA